MSLAYVAAAEKLRDFIRHPVTQLVTGVILFLSGALDIAYDLMDTEKSFHWGVHHGVALLGLVQVLGSLPDCIDGLERALSGMEKHER